MHITLFNINIGKGNHVRYHQQAEARDLNDALKTDIHADGTTVGSRAAGFEGATPSTTGSAKKGILSRIFG